MQVEVTLLTRRGAAIMRRSQRVSGERIGFGRGTGNEVSLPDIRVELDAAVLVRRDGRLYIEKLGAAPLRINGRPAETAQLGPGDEVLIGPYRLQFAEPPEDADAAIAVELVQPMGDAPGRLASRIGLDSTRFSKRACAWAGFSVVAMFFLAAPLAVYWLGLIPAWHKAAPPPAPGVTALALSWSPGEISNPHRFFADQCTTCHRASFTAVPDDACVSCHQKIGAHAEKAAEIGALRQHLDTVRCTSCHEEHRGQRGTVIRRADLCLGCHRSLAETAPKADIRDVAGYPKGHPQFRATVVADAASGSLDRVAIGGASPPVDRPGIKFSHAAHLVPGGFPALGYKPMVCADCHAAEPAGQGFLPITYKARCQGCHELTFDRADLPWPGAKVPHGDDVGVAATVWNFYAGKAVQGGLADSDPPPVIRRAPGSMAAAPGTAMPQEIRDWVGRKAETALRTIVLDDKRGCAYCHYGTGPQGAFEAARLIAAAPATPSPPQRFVAAVAMRTRFLPHARFDHARHTAMACEDCHDSRRSQASGDVLIPGIENCVACHGGEGAVLHAESTCVSCHAFHRNEFGPMRASAAAH